MVELQWPGARWRSSEVCTTRWGGVSQAPYDSMNLGLHVGDESSAVQVNRARMHERPWRAAGVLDQVHGTNTVQIHQDTPDACRADGAITRETDLACTVMVADCLPILVRHAGRQVAAACGLARIGRRGWGGHRAGFGAFQALSPRKIWRFSY